MACKTDSQELADRLPAWAVPAGRPARWWRPCAAGGESIACRQNRFFTAVTEMLCMAEKSCQNAAVRAGADCVEFSGNKRDGDLDCVEKINVGGQVKSF